MQDKIKEITRKYVGKPYHHGGRGPDSYDCWGLIMAIYKDLGYEIWSIEGPYDESYQWEGRSAFIENYYRQWDKVTLPMPLCGVLFKNKAGLAIHGGVMIDSNRFIHASHKASVIISRLSDKGWKGRVEGFYKLRQIS